MTRLRAVVQDNDGPWLKKNSCVSVASLNVIWERIALVCKFAG